MKSALDSNVLEIVLDYLDCLDVALGLEACEFIKLSSRFYEKPWVISQDMLFWPHETIVDDEFIIMHLVPKFSKRLIKIEELHILGSKLTDVGLNSLSFFTENLKKLYIHTSSRITPNGIWNLSQYCKKLVCLQFCAYGKKWESEYAIKMLA